MPVKPRSVEVGAIYRGRQGRHRKVLQLAMRKGVASVRYRGGRPAPSLVLPCGVCPPGPRPRRAAVS